MCVAAENYLKLPLPKGKWIQTRETKPAKYTKISEKQN